MTSVILPPLAMNGKDPANLRGDPIPAERYYDPEFAKREWDQMWTRIWHVAGRENELEEAGDFVVHDFMHESVMIVRQEDGSLKGYFNSCAHRGIRLVTGSSSVPSFTCPYHGWVWNLNGGLDDAPDAENFPGGNPCGKIRLREVRVDTWGGFVWYTMSDEAPPLLEYLDPFPKLSKGYPLETLVRVARLRVDLRTNWKFAPDNFSESYHVQTAHPQIPEFIDQDVGVTRIEMYPNGHGRTVQPFRPSLTKRKPGDATPMFDELLRQWDVDPLAYGDFEAKVIQGWKDLKAAKRRLGAERGFLHYAGMDDEQLTDSIHTTIFPNISITFNPDSIFFMRTEPHPTDPESCSFDFWAMEFPVEGAEFAQTAMVGNERLPLQEAELDHRKFEGGKGIAELEGGVIMQDLMLAEDVQRGIRSKGYQEPYLAFSETRVRFFHEVLNDYLEGRR